MKVSTKTYVRVCVHTIAPKISYEVIICVLATCSRAPTQILGSGKATTGGLTANYAAPMPNRGQLAKLEKLEYLLLP